MQRVGAEARKQLIKYIVAGSIRGELQTSRGYRGRHIEWKTNKTRVVIIDTRKNKFYVDVLPTWTFFRAIATTDAQGLYFFKYLRIRFSKNNKKIDAEIDFAAILNSKNVQFFSRVLLVSSRQIYRQESLFFSPINNLLQKL